MEPNLSLSSCVGQYKRLLRHYEFLGTVEPGQKLELVTEGEDRRHLQCSSGDNRTWLGWIAQAVQRAATNFMQYAQADAGSVLNFMERQNARFRYEVTSLAQSAVGLCERDDAIRQNVKEILAATAKEFDSSREVLKKAAMKTYSLADTYQSQPKFYPQFQAMGREIEALSDTCLFSAKVKVAEAMQVLEIRESLRVLELEDSRLMQQLREEEALSIDVNTSCALLAQEGSGPNVLGRLYSYGNTLVQRVGSLWSLRHPARRYSDPMVRSSLWPLGAGGRELNSSVFAEYLKLLKERNGGVDFFPKFIFGYINLFPLDEVRAAVEGWKGEIDTRQALILPFCVKAEGYWESNHIVLLIASKEYGVEYFDPRGMGTKSQELGEEGATLENVVQLCREILLEDGAAPLVENLRAHQLDCHNCGAYGLYYLHRRFEQGCSPQEAMAEDIPANVLEEFKVGLIDQLAPSMSAAQRMGEDEESLSLGGLSSEELLSSSDESSEVFSE